MHLSALLVEIDVVDSFWCLTGAIFPNLPDSGAGLDEVENAALPKVSKVRIHDVSEPHVFLHVLSFRLTDPFNRLDAALAFFGRFIGYYDIAGKRPAEFVNELHEVISV